MLFIRMHLIKYDKQIVTQEMVFIFISFTRVMTTSLLSDVHLRKLCVQLLAQPVSLGFSMFVCVLLITCFYSAVCNSFSQVPLFYSPASLFTSGAIFRDWQWLFFVVDFQYPFSSTVDIYFWLQVFEAFVNEQSTKLDRDVSWLLQTTGSVAYYKRTTHGSKL